MTPSKTGSGSRTSSEWIRAFALRSEPRRLLADDHRGLSRNRRKLPWSPQVTGSNWSRRVQVDVVAVNWQTRHILVGECKWGDDLVSRAVVRERIDVKTPLALRELPNTGQGWTVTYALFARAGITEAATQEPAAHQGIAIDVQRLTDDLALAQGE